MEGNPAESRDDKTLWCIYLSMQGMQTADAILEPVPCT